MKNMDQFENLGMDTRKILKWVLEKVEWHVLDSHGLLQEHTAGCCEHGNECHYINCKEYSQAETISSSIKALPHELAGIPFNPFSSK
jgi:hypothetical protein